MRVMNSRESIKAEFTSIDERIDRKITVYLMGGGAMTFRGLKNSTKSEPIFFIFHSREKCHLRSGFTRYYPS